MPRICAIFTHFGSAERSLTCLKRLGAQTRLPEHVLIINNSTPNDKLLPEARKLATEIFPPNTLHILQMESNLGNAGGCAHGIEYAFATLKADFVWVLDDDSWPRPHSLERLLAVEAGEETVRMSMVIDPTKDDELSWPLTINTDNEHRPWLSVIHRADLPSGNIIPSRAGWLGALYPREAWRRAGVPTAELFIRGEDEEYPWKVRNAGFSFVTVVDSPLEHPSSKFPLICYRVGKYSYFYEPALPESRQYYKMRNWAWLQRLKHPKNAPLRLVACGFYILLTLRAMLQTNEVTLLRLYTLFRALHNGFYGKLRPY